MPGLDELLELCRWEFGVEDPAVLDWTGAMRVRTRITDPPARDERPDAPARNTVVFGPSGDALAHGDRSVHVVVLAPAPLGRRQAEARRVARDAVIELSADGVAAFVWLRAAGSRRPEVTVLVPTADSPEQLEACLQSLGATVPRSASVEVVVADAGTTRAAAAVVAGRVGLRHVLADPDRGAVGAVNPGAEAARGDLLVVVGDRTRVLPGWLRPLVRTLRNEPDVGIVGGRLLAAGGVVEHAGGVLFRDGTAVGVARGVHRQRAPELDFGREVDWVPAALLATRRGLLRRLGGMDPLVGKAYGDVDLCLRVRAAGLRVRYQPESVAIGSVGEPEPHPWFLRRWRHRLASCPERPAVFDDATWLRLLSAS